MTEASERAARDDERQRCVQTLRGWADETLAAIMAGSKMPADTPIILRMASMRLRDGAEHFAGPK